jgi:hypothetical protein
VGSLQTANHPLDQNTRKRQTFHFFKVDFTSSKQYNSVHPSLTSAVVSSGMSAAIVNDDSGKVPVSTGVSYYRRMLGKHHMKQDYGLLCSLYIP